jgi:hypothetical protein
MNTPGDHKDGQTCPVEDELVNRDRKSYIGSSLAVQAASR